MKLWVAGILAAVALSAQNVEVTVLNSGGGTPLPGVKVELAQNGSAIRRANTDERGVARIEAVAPGEYSVELTRSGYRHLRTRNLSRRIRVAEGGVPIRVEERMMRLGSVSGRVLGAGTGIVGAEVRLLRVGDFGGLVERSGEGGAFDFREVDPGTNVLSARPGKASAAPADPEGRRMGWVRTWYPSSPDSAGGSRVLVSGGVDLQAQDVDVRAVPVWRVTGRVLSPAGDPVDGASVKAMPPEEFQAGDFELQTRTGKDGAFEFEAVPEGDWRISAEAKSGGADLYTARTETVASRDSERIEIRFVTPFPVTGRVVLSATGAASVKPRIGVMLAPREGGFHLSWGNAGDDGVFHVENVAQGWYRFQPTSPGAQFYLASVEMSGRDVVGEYVEITPGTLPVTITYRTDGGTVRGAVDECNGATVVLAPREAVLQYAEFVRQVKCGTEGRFEIGVVRPGEYYAFAFDRNVSGLELGSFVSKWLNQAVRVTVRAGEVSDVSLKVTQRGAY